MPSDTFKKAKRKKERQKWLNTDVTVLVSKHLATVRSLTSLAVAVLTVDGKQEREGIPR